MDPAASGPDRGAVAVTSIVQLAERCAAAGTPPREVRRLAAESATSIPVSDALAAVEAPAGADPRVWWMVGLIGHEVLAVAGPLSGLVRFHQVAARTYLAVNAAEALGVAWWHASRLAGLMMPGSSEWSWYTRMGATCAAHAAIGGVAPGTNFRRAAAAYKAVRRQLLLAGRTYSDEDLVKACGQEADCRTNLAKFGGDPDANFRRAAALYRFIRRHAGTTRGLPPTSLFNEALARYHLATRGFSGPAPPDRVFRLVICLSRMATEAGEDPDLVEEARLLQAQAFEGLGRTGHDPVRLIRRAGRVYRDLADGLKIGSERWFLLTAARLRCCTRLASLGAAGEDRIRALLRFLHRTRRRLPPGVGAPTELLIEEANLFQMGAEIGVDPVANLWRAIDLHQRTRQVPGADGEAVVASMLNEANCRQRLAEFGVEARDNLIAATKLHAAVRQPSLSQGRWFTRLGELGQVHEAPAAVLAPVESAHSMVAEANAWRLLSDEGYFPQASAERAIALAEAACREAPLAGTALADALMARANAHLAAGNASGNDAHFHRAADLFVEAREHYPLGSRFYAWTVLNEAQARAAHGEGANPGLVRLVRDLVDRCREGRGPFPADSFEYARGELVAARLAAAAESDAAWESYRRSIEVFDRVRDRIGSSEHRAGYTERIAFAYKDAVACALGLADSAGDARPDRLAEVWGWVLRSKGRGLRELLAGSTAVVDRGRTARAEVIRASAALDHAERGGRSPGQDGGDRSGDVDWARERYARAWREFLEQIEEYSDFRPPPAPDAAGALASLRDLAELGRRPGDRPLLVEYYRLSAEEVAAFVVPLAEDGGPTVVRLPAPRDAVRDICTRLLDLTRRTDPAEQGDFARLLDDVGRMILDPLEPAITEARPTELVIAAGDLLNLLPIHAATYRGAPLITHWPVSFLPSSGLAPELARLASSSAAQATAVVIGDPLGDLHAARWEAGEVERLLTEHGIPAQAIIGTGATAERVAAALDSATLVHYSGHTRLEASDFLRTGLELHDRRLTVFDLLDDAGRPRSGLTYLSSCDSALTLPTQADEFMALVRAFLVRSPSVIATLWPVWDESSAEMAVRFYSRWLGRGVAVNEAVRGAVLAMRDEFPNPRFWAPLVLIGAWRQTSCGWPT